MLAWLHSKYETSQTLSQKDNCFSVHIVHSIEVWFFVFCFFGFVCLFVCFGLSLIGFLLVYIDFHFCGLLGFLFCFCFYYCFVGWGGHKVE